MKSDLLVFTNSQKLDRVIAGWSRKWTIEDLGSGNTCYKFVEEDSRFIPTDVVGGQPAIYFVDDDIDYQYFKGKLLGRKRREDIRLIVHSKPGFDFPDLGIATTQIEEGRHEPVEKGGRVYPHILETLDDDEGEKIFRILNKVFPDPSNWELLRELYNGTKPQNLDGLFKTVLSSIRPSKRKMTKDKWKELKGIRNKDEYFAKLEEIKLLLED